MQTVFKPLLVWLLVVFLALPWPSRPGAQTTGTALQPAEIEQLVAPIALYPDSLVSQILIASTYPLEIVEANRWATQNKNLKGDALTAALEKQPWDPSVKSLVNFPQVLSSMDAKLDLTQRLGDAFLAQQKDVLDAIQRLRAKAQAAGNLQTTKEQKVIVQQDTPQTTVIQIEPANPQVVYVPTYNPTVVYGAWPYPAYPPYSYYPPGAVAATAAFSFTAGVALGAAWGYAWGGCNWHGGDVDIDVNRNVNINRNINRTSYQQQLQARGQINQAGRGAWQHDATHRRGVSYRDQTTAQRFNRGTNSQAAQAREAFRGRAETGRQDLARGGADRLGQRDTVGRAGAGGGGRGERSSVGSREGGLGDRQGQGLSSRQGQGFGDRSGAGRGTGGGREAAAFQGLGRGGDVHSASARGSASRRSSGSFGGGARGGGGGGFRGGGGGRR